MSRYRHGFPGCADGRPGASPAGGWRWPRGHHYLLVDRAVSICQGWVDQHRLVDAMHSIIWSAQHDALLARFRPTIILCIVSCSTPRVVVNLLHNKSCNKLYNILRCWHAVRLFYVFDLMCTCAADAVQLVVWIRRGLSARCWVLCCMVFCATNWSEWSLGRRQRYVTMADRHVGAWRLLVVIQSTLANMTFRPHSHLEVQCVTTTLCSFLPCHC